ncbi:SGNH/GDSL hydrolase family protein [Nocardia inohanensis]|uniref:SGNH/GDSL hydrolase family protein n=1 Tax=Nocardia inohanensis TaxID=209246 RepID=UPI001FE1798F|nr:SGNH/GDSL hydrolase family protein [Nocardia inohanensis]
MLAALGFGFPVTGTAAPAMDPIEYVNLGDSFSAGVGLLPIQAGSPLYCRRSTRNFAHVIAERRGYRLIDVSCGSATTEDLYRPQLPGVAPQLDAVTATTRLITLTLGGNNNAVFADSVAKCGLAFALEPTRDSPCRDSYGDYFEAAITARTYPALIQALEGIHAKAPQAQVIIAGYPWLVPQQGTCFPEMPIAAGDYSYFRGIQATLNDTVRRAAQASGTTYVDMSAASEGHDACQPADRRYAEPLIFANQFMPLHPNAAGETAIAEEIAKVIDDGA